MDEGFKGNNVNIVFGLNVDSLDAGSEKLWCLLKEECS